MALTPGGTTTITGTYPNFTISSADQFQGTVTSVTGTSPVASSGGATPAISLSAGYGDTQNPYASKTANFVLAAPNGSAGVPTFRAIVAADIPTLNQNTTGTASNVTGTVAIANGGTGATTAATALTNLGAVAKAGDTMTGALGFVAGSASTPSLFASGDTNTGIFFPAADTIAFAEGGAEAMRIDSSGNVGIGTTSPTANRRLDAVLNANASTGIRVVNNDAGSATSTNTTYSNGTTTAEFGMLGTGYGSYGVLTAGNGYIYVGSNKALQLSSDGGFIAFGTGTTGAERARIDSSGNLLVGKTSTSATTQGGYISSAGQYVVAQPASTGAVFFQNTSGGATVGTITINASTTTYGTSSDYRLKENIVPMVGALSAVSALKPVTYNWKIDGSDGQGFIAHELAEVCPEAVQGKKDAVDDEGNPVYQGIDTSFLVATLTAAIQEQQALITQLQADVAALKGA